MKEEEKIENNMNASVIIDTLLKELGLTAPKFAEEVGINYQRVFDLQRGRTKKFNPGVVNKICARFPQVSKNYLYTGEGEVLTDAPTSNVSNNTSSLGQTNIAEFMAMSHKLLQLFEQLQSKDVMLSTREAELLKRERELNAIERELNKREHDLNQMRLQVEQPV